MVVEVKNKSCVFLYFLRSELFFFNMLKNIFIHLHVSLYFKTKLSKNITYRFCSQLGLRRRDSRGKVVFLISGKLCAA
jgi:hypothetical protein